ncbi:MAG: HAMP domain-containing protein [Chloroflexi bacterium]|nr:HAMP domain-containing protein [Chloroflexota bacterium]
MHLFDSLRMKLVLVFVGLILIAVTGMGLYGYLFTRTALSGQALDRSSYQVHLQAESLDSSLQQTRGDALYLSVLRSLQMLCDLRRNNDTTDQAEVWRNEVAQDFLMFSSVRPMYQAIRYIDARGQEIVGIESDGHQVSVDDDPSDWSGSSYFQSTMALEAGGVYVSAFAQDVDELSTGRPIVHYTIKLPDNNGIVLIDLHAGWLLRNLPADPDADVWVLLDQDGHYLVYPEQLDVAHTTLDVHPLLTGQAGRLEADDSVLVYDAIHPSEATPERFWVLFRQTPQSLFYADVTTFYTITTAVFIGAVMVSLALSLVASERILKPLLDLERQVASFGRGGTAPVLKERPSSDEVGALTRTFYEMAQELERKRIEEHRLIEKLINAQEEERKLVAYDLHDGLIQQLVGARLYLTNCCELCRLHGGSECNGVRSSSEALADAIIEGRRIVEGLRPAALDDLGLTVALVDVAQSNARASSWDLKLDVQSLSSEPDKIVGVTLFRIAQEALNNIRKHADARQVRLSVHNGVGIDMVIEDDGKGFDLDIISHEGRGLGVTTMKERASLIHGACEIESKPGQGTRVHVHVPLTPPALLPPPVPVKKRDEL